GAITYTVTSGPANGQLEFTTNPGVAITSFIQADIDAGYVVYVHDGSSTTRRGFGFDVDDGQGNSVTEQRFVITVAIGGGISELNDTKTEINNIDGSLCKNGQKPNDLTKIIDKAIASIQNGKMKKAITILEHRILETTNGCANNGSWDGNDLIQDCRSQAVIYDKVTGVLDLLRKP
ncbi:MAG: hypothetical protein GY781_20930, partial [Gammaproteobacteria bacterium]|nr:hypothetical protein [Gammaproteobacteria bacterium]